MYPDLKARSAYLKEVARGRVADHTVRIKDYHAALEGWMKLARGGTGGRGKNKGEISSSSSASGGIAAARGAKSLLRALEHNMHNPEMASPSTVLRPTATIYDVVLQVYAVCGGGVVAAKEAQALLDNMLENARAATLPTLPRRWNPHFPEPSVSSYNIVLNCWARAGSKDSGIRAEEVFARMEEWRNDCHVALQRDPSFPYRGCYPTTETLSSLFYALTKSKALNAPDRAWQLLQEVVEVQRNPSMSEHRFRDVRLDPWLFNTVTLSWMRSGRGRDAAAKAEEILSLAGTLQAEGLMEEPPCKRMYALVLDAWSKCEDSTGECAQRAHDLLFKMIRLYRQGAPLELNAVAFGTCIAAWSRCANVKDAPEKAEAILQELLILHKETGLVDFHPNFVVWNSLQVVWLHATERTDSVDRGAEIIQRMQKHGCQPSIVLYGRVVHAAGQRGLGDQALALLDQYAVDSNIPLYRDVRTFNSVLDALARESRDDAMDRATAFFEKMKCQDSYANPDACSYAILLDAMLRSKGCRHAERGRDLLEEMMERFQQGDESCRPNVHNVSVVLKLCAYTTGTEDDRRRALDIALETFRKCESYYGVSPNHFVYSAMLHAYSRLAEHQQSNACQLAEQGLRILEEMMQRFQQGDESCRPNVHNVSVVLKLCAETNGTDDDRRRAQDIALETFQKCESYYGVSPNHFVYSAMLHATNRLTASEDERLELLEKVFEECRALGLVSDAAVRIMHRGGASHFLSGLSAFSSRQVPHKDRPYTTPP